jgi:uncharacterized UPF0160 family protein
MNDDSFLKRSFGTHDGTFHADEVTACALLHLFGLIDLDKIVRTRDPFLLKKCEFVCDVGGVYNPSQNRFDHHQVDYQGTLSSAGMVLVFLKNKGYLSQVEYDLLNHELILGVDAHDNGKESGILGLCTFSHVISNFNPIHHEFSQEESNEAFFKALTFTLEHLKRKIDRYHFAQSSKEIVKAAMEKDSFCLMFDQSIPWFDVFFDLGGESHPAKFLIMPAKEHWKLRGIPPTYHDKMGIRWPLPKSWAGLLDEELQKVTGIPGAIFCHKGRFISVWKTKEDALMALNKVVNS